MFIISTTTSIASTSLRALDPKDAIDCAAELMRVGNQNIRVSDMVSGRIYSFEEFVNRHGDMGVSL